jgi:hypothetical protein
MAEASHGHVDRLDGDGLVDRECGRRLGGLRATDPRDADDAEGLPLRLRLDAPGLRLVNAFPRCE